MSLLGQKGDARLDCEALGVPPLRHVPRTLQSEFPQVLVRVTRLLCLWCTRSPVVAYFAGRVYTAIWVALGFIVLASVALAQGSLPQQVLYKFQGGTDGEGPLGGLIFDSSGNLYGTTVEGDLTTCYSGVGCGTVFELSPNGVGGWTEKVLYRFQGGSNDGEAPEGGVVQDQNGNFYGTTSEGRNTACSDGCGTVFELSPNGSGGWTETRYRLVKSTSWLGDNRIRRGLAR